MPLAGLELATHGLGMQGAHGSLSGKIRMIQELL